MSGAPVDTQFTGSIPEIYEKYLVPLIFEPYAIDLAARLARISVSDVLELAAGTGVVTRRLALELPARVAITATDLDAAFDAVVCQFGVMFFPDKPRALAEARRVLRPGGVFLFNAWDRIEENEIPRLVTAALATVFPNDPPRFMARVPHGYHDVGAIRRDLTAAGFAREPGIESVAARSRCASARIAATAFARELHYAQRSRRAILPDSPQPPRMWRVRSHGTSGPAQ